MTNPEVPANVSDALLGFLQATAASSRSMWMRELAPPVSPRSYDRQAIAARGVMPLTLKSLRPIERRDRSARRTPFPRDAISAWQAVLA